MNRLTAFLIVFVLVWGFMPRGADRVTRDGVSCWDHGKYILCVGPTVNPGYRPPLIAE